MAWLLDGGVLLAYFLTVISIGLYKGRGDKTMEGFAVGNRSIPWWAVLASILAAEISAATFLGAPDEGYVSRNYTYAQLAVGTLLARVVVAFVFIKPYYDFRVVSIYEFLRVRFGERTKNGASAVFLITRALASGTRLYVAAVVLVLGYETFSGVALAPLQQVWIYIASLVFLTAATGTPHSGASRRSSGRTSSRRWSCSVRSHLRFGRCFTRSRTAGTGRWPYSTLPKT
jgi:solute:Na+ symporter, SSS family